MSGQLRVLDAAAEPAKHTHLTVDLDSGETQLPPRHRRFGTALVLADALELETFFEKSGLGPEPFDVPATLRARLAAAHRP